MFKREKETEEVAQRKGKSLLALFSVLGRERNMQRKREIFSSPFFYTGFASQGCLERNTKEEVDDEIAK